MNGQLNIQLFQQAEQQQIEDFNNVQPIQNEDDQQQQQQNNVFSAESLVEVRNDDDMHTLCNFTCEEFLRLYNVVSFPLIGAHTGGRHSKFSPETQFLITLMYLKSAMPLHDLAFELQISVSYLSTLIWETIKICAPILERWAIRWISYEEDVATRHLFQNFPNCVCAVDASVQEIPKPRHNQKLFYSGKHHYHCLKMQVAVAPSGLAINVHGPYPGSVHDFKIFQETDTRNLINAERQNYQVQNPGQPGVSALFDKGYIGANRIIVDPVMPIKKPYHREYTEQEIDHNNRVAHDRIIVERWFGRMKRIWKIMFECFPLKTAKYNYYYRMCAALTNFHVLRHPLTDTDPVDPFNIEDD